METVLRLGVFALLLTLTTPALGQLEIGFECPDGYSYDPDDGDVTFAVDIVVLSASGVETMFWDLLVKHSLDFTATSAEIFCPFPSEESILPPFLGTGLGSPTNSPMDVGYDVALLRFASTDPPCALASLGLCGFCPGSLWEVSTGDVIGTIDFEGNIGAGIPPGDLVPIDPELEFAGILNPAALYWFGLVGNPQGATEALALTCPEGLASFVDGLSVDPAGPCEPAVIESTSSDLLVCDGDPFVLEVIATGSSLSYQWRQNAVDIPGAESSTYSIVSAQPGDSGTYDCVVSNSCSSVPSAPIEVTVSPCAPDFIRGDCDGNGIYNPLADALHCLGFAFLGGPPPPCAESSDADGDAVYNGLADSLYILGHGFLGGPAPSGPFPACGQDPDPGASLGCNMSGCP